MDLRMLAGLTAALMLGGASGARAELRHVEIRTLGMD
jgi:hypothetical protein